MQNTRLPPSSTRPIANGAVHGYGRSHDYDHVDNAGHKKQPAAVAVSLLQPRVAVLLGLPKRWYRTLFICRLLCLVPCFWWGVRIALRFLVAQVLQRANRREQGEETSLRLTEALLAAIWCLASATLAFYFADCLMSRWLINYTAQATVVRLLTISCVFAYLTSWIVYLTGGTHDPSLLLPAWIGIATILTACYHFTQRKVPIRKETVASISVFSIASFVSLIALLLEINITRPLPETHIPLVSIMKIAAEMAGRIIVKILGVNKDGT